MFSSALVNSFFNFSDVYARMHFCVFAILFSIAVLSATFITVISSFIIYFYYLFLFFFFDMDHWSDTNK